MGRLIDVNKLRDVLLKEIDKFTPPLSNTDGAIRCGIRLAMNIAEDQPIIDAEPVRHGKWEETDNSHCTCSACGAEWNVFENDTEWFNFCPNCGADMRGEDGKTKRKPPQVNPEMVKALQDRIEKQRGEE